MRKLVMENDSHCDVCPYRVNITKHVTISFLLQRSPIHKAWNIRSYFTRDCFLDILNSLILIPIYVHPSERLLGSHDKVAPGYAITSYTDALYIFVRK